MLSPSLVWAERVMKTFPVDTPTSRSEDSAVCWAGPTRKISLINLSNIPQNITVNITDIEMSFGACDGAVPSPPFGGNWIKYDTSACYRTPIMKVPNGSKKIKLGPNQSGTVTFGARCRIHKSGVTSCGLDVPATPLVAAGMNQNSVITARATIEIIVKEDRGAVAANIIGMTNNNCGTFTNNSSVNIPVNGGRPF